MPLTKSESKMLEAGERDKPVTIEQLVETVDASGSPTGTWSTLEQVEWMSRRTLSGTERIAAIQVSAPVDTLWTLAYREDMDPDLLDVPKLRRLRYENRTFNIRFAQTLDYKAGIQLTTVSKSG